MYEYTIIADLHCHTLASDHAYSTVNDIAEEAARKRLTAVAITDHGNAIPDSPHPWHFQSQANLTPYVRGVRVLRGVEANVTGRSGELDLSNEELARLDVVVASMHTGSMPPSGREDCTAAWLGVADNPQVDIIGHSGTPDFAYDYEAVIPVFGRMGKAVEINENTFAVRRRSLDNCRTIAALCKRHGVPIVVNADSHFHAHVGEFRRSLALLREMGFPPELIVNGSVAALNRFFRRKNIVFG